MRIEVEGFENGAGVRFRVTASNLAEKALLAACVDDDILTEIGEEISNEFRLNLLVSN